MPTSCVASASESTVGTPTIIPTASSQANIITTTTVTAKGFPRKPPPLPPRQMSLPKPAPQLPDIEDEDEESTPPAVTDKEAEAAAEANLRITGQMVASASNLSSWSSTASVATRTNTDNPASMSHYVTNFNITKLARQQQQLGSRSAGQPSSASADHLQGAKKDQKKTTEDVPLKVFKQTPV